MTTIDPIRSWANQPREPAIAATRRRPRVLIAHQGCVPIYREPLFQRLGMIADIDYVIAHGDPPRGAEYLTAKGPFSFANIAITNKEAAVIGKQIIWQPLVRRFWRDFDAVVLGDEFKFVSHMPLIAAAKLRRRPVLLWGFGYRPDYADELHDPLPTRLVTSLFKSWRLKLLKSVDGYLAYTSAGAARLAAQGFRRDRIVTVNNTVDIAGARHWAARMSEERESDTREALGITGRAPVLLFFGRLQQSKSVELLIDYVRRANESGRAVNCVIIGSGVKKGALVERAAGSPSIRFFESDPGGLTLARALMVASAVVIPGSVGLAITHGFAHDVPIITREGRHPPEIEYLEHGFNGLMLPQPEDAFFTGVDRFLDDPDLQARLARGAHATAEALSIDRMAEKFDSLVRRLLIEWGHGSLTDRAAVLATRAAAAGNS